jgi:DNA excision repair protein ERCC-2
MEPSDSGLLTFAVRDFVAPLERRGSLNTVRSFGLTGSMRQVGAEIHAAIQTRTRDTVEGYRAEVVVQHTLELTGARLTLTGRLDGLYETAEAVVVEEIKTTTNPRALVAELARNPEHPYLLQAQLYAWMLASSPAFDTAGRELRVRLRVVSALDPSDERLHVPHDEPFDVARVGRWVHERAAALLRLQQSHLQRQRQRQGIGASLRLPFEAPRQGQLELMAEVERTLRTGQRLLLQAPTGLGKTAAVLVPHLIDAMSEGRQVFYVTPKNSQHRVAQEAVEHLRARGHDVKGVVITGKEKSCLKDEVICDPTYCEYARGYYDKLHDTPVLETLAEAGMVDFDTLRQAGQQHEVCPFELSLDATALADVVVCDYNYVFSPSAALQRYFEDDARAHRVSLVVDEAHNLYPRAMELYSPRLARPALRALHERGVGALAQLRTSGGGTTERLSARWARLNEQVQQLLADCASRVVPGPERPVGGDARASSVVTVEPDGFFALEARIGRLLSAYAERVELLRPSDPVVELFQLWGAFCSVLRLGGEEFVFTWQGPVDDGALQCTCCDASRFLKPRLAALHAVTAFSATLKPFDFYARMSGFDTDTLATREFASPFPAAHRKLLVVPQISTAYRDRARNVAKVAELVNRVLPLRRGNYFVFFPSFAFLGAVAPHLALPGFRVWSQRPGMTPAETQQLLAKFRQKTKNVVVLAVQGGSLAEGIDLPGDDLVGAVVVGPALPGFDLERECIRDYFERKTGRGFEYAYVYPAMARVVQAAGRVIRTPDDRGLILLCDRRFVQERYTQVMPTEWLADGGLDALQSRSILQDVAAFWGGAARAPRRQVRASG